MSSHGGARKGAGSPNTKAKGTRKLSSFFVQGPKQPPVLVATEAADAKEKAAAGERIQVERRERREQDLTNQEKGLEELLVHLKGVLHGSRNKFLSL